MQNVSTILNSASNMVLWRKKQKNKAYKGYKVGESDY